MENNELNKRIIENVRNRVVISNLESEENMKINKRKQILSIAIVMCVMLTGSFTVNAATNGELAEKVKDTVRVIFTDKDGKQEEVKGTTYTDSNNHIIEKYELEKNGAEYRIEVDKNELEVENLTLKGDISDGETSLTIENKQ
ncbi:MAG: hypothetical protein K1W33_08295 [Clostridia bacterium]